MECNTGPFEGCNAGPLLQVFVVMRQDRGYYTFPPTVRMWRKGNTHTLSVGITKLSIIRSDWLHSLQLKMEKLYTVSKNKTWSWLRLELLIAKFRLKLKKAGKTTRPFRYDLNHIPYDYTVEVTNRFKVLDLIGRVLKNYGQRFVTFYRRQWSRPSPRKRNAKSKMVVWGGLRNSCEKKISKRQRRKEKIYPFQCRVPKNSKER